MALLDVEGLHVHYALPGRAHQRFAAVADVSLQCARGQCVGLVGESGCGKTTVANAIAGLLQPSAGRIAVDGVPVWPAPAPALQRARLVQMVFQDPYASLNPRLTIGATLQEALFVHGRLERAEPPGSRAGSPGRFALPSGGGAKRPAEPSAVAELLARVELDAALARHFPHELSGGQRQRVCIARALAVEPAWIVADEPVSALDVSVQVQILNLLKQLQTTLNLGIVFIAHDLGTVRYVCDTVHVMYRGRLVESGDAAALFDRPAHPYTQSLLSAVPDVDEGLRARRQGSRRQVLRGDVPPVAAQIPGCGFHPRCPRAEARCGTEVPRAVRVAPAHTSICHLAEEVAGSAFTTRAR